MEGTYALVRQAIVERQQLHASYDGHQRRMCPHVIGTKDGEARTLVFQFAGFSRRGLRPGGDWRCLLLDGLADVSIHEGPWHTRAHSEAQSCIEDIDLEIEA